jgi:hypothetical protein
MPAPEKDGRELQTLERAPHMKVVFAALPGDAMPGHSALIRFAVLVSLAVPGSASAQLVPQAGSAGAGSSAISGIPYGPANPSVVGDPSGIGNAARMPRLGTNAPAPVTSYGSVNASPSGSRVVAPRYIGPSQRITVPRQARSKRPPIRPRGRAETSSFTGICRGC